MCSDYYLLLRFRASKTWQIWGWTPDFWLKWNITQHYKSQLPRTRALVSIFTQFPNSYSPNGLFICFCSFYITVACYNAVAKPRWLTILRSTPLDINGSHPGSNIWSCTDVKIIRFPGELHIDIFIFTYIPNNHISSNAWNLLLPLV